MRRSILFAATIVPAVLTQAALDSPAWAQAQTARPHNVVLFVADGLRFRMVDDSTAPTMAAMAREGVSLRNGHALFPTFTMANASGMATGHMLGDTGTFSNTIYTGFQVPGAGNSLTPASGRLAVFSRSATSADNAMPFGVPVASSINMVCSPLRSVGSNTRAGPIFPIEAVL
jgi:Type I phosphodiesterase / nucleotide pyrophosphatase